MKPHMSDEELGLALQATLAEADPVPHEAVAAASAAFTWRDLDAALAALTSDSLMEEPLAAVRGTPGRLLSFATDDVTIDLEVTAEAGTVRMLGQLTPAQAAGIVIEYAGGTKDGRADAMGRFSVDGLPIGWLRVGVTTNGTTDATADIPAAEIPTARIPAAGIRSHTEWFRA